jgi:hypothetical protein
MAKKKPSARNLRRKAERDTEKLRDDVVRVERAKAGGSFERPVDVVSASLVDVLAVSEPCPLCGGELRLDEHAVETRGEVRVRVARLVCKMCRAPWQRFYRIVPNQLN